MSASPPNPDVEQLFRYLDASPTPYHAVAETSRRLVSSGFEELAADGAWPTSEGRHFVVRGGALIAWNRPEGLPPTSPFRIVGAHTDSPGFRIKPSPDTGSAGWRQLGVEVYGGPLLNSWLDRDLGLAGRVACRSDNGSRIELFRDDRAILRIPQLAIHLDRDINDKGLHLDRQRHLVPIWGIGSQSDDGFVDYLAATIDVDPSEVLWWDVAPFDVVGACRAGLDDDLVASARLDNQVSCHAATEAMRSAAPDSVTAVVVLFDHEEIGSTSATGAAGTLLTSMLERIVHAAGGGRDEVLRSFASSHAISSDMAHATHPNYPERHEPDHPVLLNAGPVIKTNAQQRYATDTESVLPFLMACDSANVPVQRFVSHSSMACGSTIGPMTAAGSGIPVVDVGVAQLAMHSIREVCGAEDPGFLGLALHHFFSAS